MSEGKPDRATLLMVPLGVDEDEISTRFSKNEDFSNFQSLLRWIHDFEADGISTLDTLFQCVSEGGTTFVFDPKGLEEIMELGIRRGIEYGASAPRDRSMSQMELEVAAATIIDGICK